MKLQLCLSLKKKRCMRVWEQIVGGFDWWEVGDSPATTELKLKGKEVPTCSGGWCSDAQLCPTLCAPMDCSPLGSSVHGDSLGKNTGVGCHFLLKGIFLTQESNPSLLHWQVDCLPLMPACGIRQVARREGKRWRMGPDGPVASRKCVRVCVFGVRVCKEVVKVKWGYKVGS